MTKTKVKNIKILCLKNLLQNLLVNSIISTFRSLLDIFRFINLYLLLIRTLFRFVNLYKKKHIKKVN